MRKFSSYGPVDVDSHYYVPRENLINFACTQLVGDDREKGGHYITVWAPRQAGKTWIMREVMRRLYDTGDFEVGILTLQGIKDVEDEQRVLNHFVRQLERCFKRELPAIDLWDDIPSLFTDAYFDKPVILIIDEFDSLIESYINKFANQFRTIYIDRGFEYKADSTAKRTLLHSLALIGVRSVLGIENESGSPFNIQRSLNIPNLTSDEVNAMFHSYIEESGQPIEQAVIDRIFYETQGQPGLVSWLGELLTQKYNDTPDQPISMLHFTRVYGAAINLLPNNNIQNIISKAKDSLYTPLVLDLFKTNGEVKFSYDKPELNYLYTNGVITPEAIDIENYYAKFSSPFVQKRLFNYFTNQLFPDVSRLHDPFLDLSPIITDTHLDIGELSRLYENYVQENRDQLFKNAPLRKTDGRIFEAVYHFNFFAYLRQFLQSYRSQVLPEFPTGNGKIDLIIQHSGQRYGLEIKSFVNEKAYQTARTQAAQYARQLDISQIWLIMFIDYVDDDNRRKYEVDYVDKNVTGQPVTVSPRFIATGK